jgi:CRISPR type IV-associated protein Csf1
MPQLIYPSALARQGAKIDPIISIKAEHDDRCVMCAVPITEGSECNYFSPGKTFMSYPELAKRGGEYVCGDCQALWERPFLQKYSNSVITTEGFWNFSSNANQAHFIRNPPEPPFLIICSTTQQQHLIWRAPVNYSKDILFVRFGDNVFIIRRQVVIELADRIIAMKGKHKNASLVIIDRKANDPGTGKVTTLGAEYMPDLEAEIRQLKQGELWALGALINASGKPTLEPVL